MAAKLELSELNPHIQGYLEKQRAKNESSFMARKSDLVDFQDWLNDNGHELEEVTTWVLDDYFTDLQADGYAPNTIKCRWDSVMQVFNYMTLRDIVDEHPMDPDEFKRRDYLQSKKREHVEAEEIAYVSKDELELMVTHAPSPKLRNKLLLRLMWQTGVRSNEVVRIRLDDIDRDEHSIEIYSKKTGGKRTVFYQESLDFLLTEWLDRGYRASNPEADESEYLFLTRNSERLSDRAVNPIVKQAAENAGIQEVVMEDQMGRERHRITAHALRHGHGVYSLKCGIDIRTIQKHMGHQSLDMTMRYLQIIDEDVRDAYQADFGTV